MSLERKAIRLEVCRLLQGKTLAGVNVFANRIESLPTEKLPALVVHTRSEQITTRNETPRRYLRLLRLSVEGFVTQIPGERNDDQADELAAQVESALLPNLLLERLTEGPSSVLTIDVSATTYEGARFEPEPEGERLLGAFALDFVWAYLTPVDEIDAELVRERLGDFLAMRTSFDLEPADGVIDLVDEISLQGG